MLESGESYMLCRVGSVTAQGYRMLTYRLLNADRREWEADRRIEMSEQEVADRMLPNSPAVSALRGYRRVQIVRMPTLLDPVPALPSGAALVAVKGEVTRTGAREVWYYLAKRKRLVAERRGADSVRHVLGESEVLENSQCGFLEAEVDGAKCWFPPRSGANEALLRDVAVFGDKIVGELWGNRLANVTSNAVFQIEREEEPIDREHLLEMNVPRTLLPDGSFIVDKRVRDRLEQKYRDGQGLY